MEITADHNVYCKCGAKLYAEYKDNVITSPVSGVLTGIVVEPCTKCNADAKVRVVIEYLESFFPSSKKEGEIDGT